MIWIMSSICLLYWCFFYKVSLFPISAQVLPYTLVTLDYNKWDLHCYLSTSAFTYYLSQEIKYSYGGMGSPVHCNIIAKRLLLIRANKTHFGVSDCRIRWKNCPEKTAEQLFQGSGKTGFDEAWKMCNKGSKKFTPIWGGPVGNIYLASNLVWKILARINGKFIGLESLGACFETQDCLLILIMIHGACWRQATAATCLPYTQLSYAWKL